MRRSKVKEIYFREHEMAAMQKAFPLKSVDFEADLKGLIWNLLKCFSNSISPGFEFDALDGSEVLKVHPRNYIGTNLRPFPSTDKPRQIYSTCYDQSFVKIQIQISHFFLLTKI